MEAFGTRMRGGVATLLSAALILSGALLAAPAASAEEPVAQAPVAEVAPADAIAESQAPASAEAQPEAPTEDSAAPEAEPSAEAPAEAPAADSEPTSAAAATTPAALAADVLPQTLEPVRAGGGALDWGFKASWRSYLTTWAAGNQQAYGGATLSQDGTVHYPESTESSYDPATGTGEIAYTGGVQWKSEAHGFTIAMQNPRIAVAADGSASVSAEMSTEDTAGASSVVRLVIATIGAVGTPAKADDTAHWSAVSGVFAQTLAPAGVSRYAGQATDPFSFSTPAAAPVVTPVWEPAISVALADGTPLAAGAKVYKDDVLVVSGSGFDPLSHPRPVAGRPPVTAGDPTGNYVVFGNFAEAWRPSTGATGSARVVGDQRWAMTDATFGNIAPNYVSAVRAQRVALGTDGTFTAELTAKAAASAPGSYGVFTYVAGGGANDAAQELELRLDYVDSVRPKAWTPAITVSLADGTPLAAGAKVYKGDKIVVRGSGFDPESNVGGRGVPIPNTLPQGAYAVFGKFGDVWKPSTGAASSQRKVGSQQWVLSESVLNQVPAQYQGIVRAQWAPLSADGTFAAEFTLDDAKDAAQVTGSYGVFTYGAGGVNNASQELEVRLDYVASERPAEPSKPAVKVAAVSVDGQQGLKVDVNATGLPGNIYAALIERGTAGSLDRDSMDKLPAFAVPFPTVTDGVANFTLTAPMTKLDRKKQYEVLVWRQHSVPDATTTYGQADVAVTEAQWDELQGIKPPVVVPPTKPQPTLPGAGSLTWGISSSFANYVTGTIAKGSISTHGVGGGRGGYVFPQATGSSWNADTRTGTVRYSGTVTFTGHGGLLSETFSNPVITVSSPTSGTISAGGQSFPLNLTGAGFTANADGSATWSGVSVGGAISGGDGGGAGGSLGMDSLSFTVGSVSALNFGSTSTVSQFAKKREAAATAPASTGLTVVTPTAKLVAGGEIEITAGGFQPNEQGILVVIYSEPTVLDTNAKADANGVVRWIGTLPKDLAGKHTITLQGSVNVGQEITIAKAGEVKEKTTTVAAETSAPMAQAAAAGETSGVPAWAWWTGTLALLVIAGAGTALVVAQRRKVDTPTHL